MTSKLARCLGLVARLEPAEKLGLRVQSHRLQKAGMESASADRQAVSNFLNRSRAEEAALREALSPAPEIPNLGASVPRELSAYNENLPDKMGEKSQRIMDSLYAKGVNTPEKLAGQLYLSGPERIKYSQRLWFSLMGAGADGPAQPPWPEIYAQLQEAIEASSAGEQPTETNPGGAVDVSTPAELSQAVRAALAKGPLDRRGLAAMAAGLGMDAKRIDEAAELGVVLRAREIVAEGGTPEETFDRLLELYQWQPNLIAKTSTSKINQAYSTPIPMAYVGSRLGDLKGGKIIVEPTAGNGALLIEIEGDTPEAPSRAIVNEIDPTRRANLTAQGLGGASDVDATKWTLPKHVAVDREAMNPPFGVIRDADGNPLEWTIDGLTTHQIDHAIALQTLSQMTDDGRAVLIIGGTQALQPNERRKHYGNGEIGEFFKKLYAEYGVIEHFTVNGDLYAKQGAGWPVDIIVIQGRRSAQIQLPTLTPPRILNSWEELRNELSKSDEDRIRQNQYDPEKDREELGGHVAGIRGALQVPKRPEGAQPALQPGAGGRPGGTGKGVVPTGQGSPARLPGGEIREDTRTGQGAGGSGLLPKPDADRGVTEEKFHEPYVPVAKGPSFTIETPKNIAKHQREALERVEREVGKPLVEYVREKLDYAPGEDLGKYFAAEQLDALALGIYNIENGGALVVGDQTGIGKGRVAAGLLHYAHLRGFTPIFVTNDPKLYAAMLNDFADIGKDVSPFYTNNNLELTNPDTGKLIVKQGSVKREVNIIAAAKALPKEYTAVFTTYHQIGKEFDPKQSIKDRHAAVRRGGVPQPGPRNLMLTALAPKALFVLDEAHLASGLDSIIGRRVRTLIAAKGSATYYSSATFAKRPDSMPLYFRTNLRLAAGDNPKAMVDVFQNGGVVMQQIASGMLAQDGQYLRRERTYDGVSFRTHINWDTAERDYALADQYTHGLRTILEMSNAVKRATKSLNDIMNRIGKQLSVPTIKMESTDFASKIHNFVNQYLLAIKAEAAVQQALEAIKTGHPTGTNDTGPVKKHKVIIAVMNTMEGPIRDLLAGKFDLSFTGLLMKTLEGLRMITSGKKDAQGNSTYFFISRTPNPDLEHFSDRMLEQDLVKIVPNPNAGEGQPATVGVVNEPVAMELFRRMANAAFLDAEKALGTLNLGDMPLSPIDYIRQRLESEGIRTGEITGREIGLDRDGNLYERSDHERSSQGQLETLGEFNNTDMDALVINASASTGVSAHASEKFQRRDPRMLIVAQPHGDINIFMQILGRIFRSGQVEIPRYMLLQTALPAERRPAAMLGEKMKGLNANTTSNTESQVSEGAEMVDMFNEYGDEMVWNYLANNRDFARALQFPKLWDGDRMKTLAEMLETFEEDGKLGRAVTSYAAILPVEDQDLAWNKVLADYKALISYLDSIGENKLKASVEDIGAEVVTRKEFTKGSDNPKSVFEAPSYLDVVKVKPRKPPLEVEEVRKLASKAESEQYEELQTYRQKARDAEEEYIKKRQGSMGWSGERENSERDRLSGQRIEIIDGLNMLGKLVAIRLGGGMQYGAVVGWEFDAEHPLTPSKQLFQIATNTLKRTIKIPASQMGEKVRETDLVGFDAEYNRTREDKATRQIITGNLIAAAAKLHGGGRVVNFTKSDGTIEPGIILPIDFNIQNVQRIPVQTPQDVATALAAGKDVTGDDGKVRIYELRGDRLLAVPSSRANGGKYWQDRAINAAMTGGEMQQRGQLMIGRIGHLQALLDRLAEMDVSLTTTGDQPLGASVPRSGKHRGPLGRIYDDVLSLFMPGAMSPEHKESANALREALGYMHRMNEKWFDRFKKAGREFDRRKVDKEGVALADNPGWKFMHARATGGALEPWMVPINEDFDRLEAEAVSDLRAAGGRMGQVYENYQAARWTPDSRAAFGMAIEKAIADGIVPPNYDVTAGTPAQRAAIKRLTDKFLKEGPKTGDTLGLAYISRQPLHGKQSFKKPKVFMDPLIGAEHGLVPFSNNPVKIEKLLLAELSRAIMANRFLREMERMGKVTTEEGLFTAPPGMVQIPDPWGTIYGGYGVPVWRIFQAMASGAKSTLYRANFAQEIFSDPGLKNELNDLKWEFDDGAGGVVERNIHAMKTATGKSYTQLVIEKLLEDHSAFQSIAPGIYYKLEQLANTEGKIAQIIGMPDFDDLTQKLPIGGRLIKGYRYATPEAAQIMDNYLSPTLYTGTLGDVYAGWMGLAGVLNAAQLGVGSAFHAGFTTLEVEISAVAKVLQDLYGYGRGKRTREQLAASLKAVLTAAGRTQQLGGQVIDAFLGRMGPHPQLAQQTADAMEMAGAGFTMERGMMTNQLDAMISDFLNDKRLKAAARLPVALLELMSHWIMRWLVPRQKAGVFAHMVERIIEQNPGVPMSRLRDQFVEAWNDVDARLGQVRWDRILMRNVAKNVLQMLIRAPGWTGGTLHQVLGAPKDAYKFIHEWATEKRLPDELPPRIAYVVGLLLLTATVNAALTFMLSGEMPKDLDYWAFRTGKKDERGNAERFVLPTYAKDILALSRAPIETLTHKTHPALSVVTDLLKNKDYYGVEIRHPDDSLPSQFYASVKYFAKSFEPFWVRGTKKELERGAGLSARTVLPLAGVMPAPRKMTQSAAERLADDYMKATLPVGGRTQEAADKSKANYQIVEALRKGDQGPLNTALREKKITSEDATKLRHRAMMTPLQYVVRNLPLDKVESVYRVANPMERKELAQILLAKRAKKAAQGAER